MRKGGSDFKPKAILASISSTYYYMAMAKMLSEQAVYNKIVEETGASTATISRVNRAFSYGSGGYVGILRKIKEENK